VTGAGLRAALGALLLLAPLQERPRGADPARETALTTAILVGEQREVTLHYRTIAWSAESMQRMRRDPAQRDLLNQRFGLVLQSELETPVALTLGGMKLAAGKWRIGLFMDEGGAFQFTVLVDGETRRFPIDLSESRQTFPYLAFTLMPAEEGLFALVLQWGTEYGRVVFEAAR